MNYWVINAAFAFAEAAAASGNQIRLVPTKAQ
jgi:hypothetical protein